MQLGSASRRGGYQANWVRTALPLLTRDVLAEPVPALPRGVSRQGGYQVNWIRTVLPEYQANLVRTVLPLHTRDVLAGGVSKTRYAGLSGIRRTGFALLYLG